MQMYQSTPDYYRDVIQHGWLSNKTHKYIDKFKNAKGEWVYRYYKAKSKRAENKTAKYRKKWGVDNETSTLYINRKGGEKLFDKDQWLKSMGNNGIVRTSGRAKSHGYDSGSRGSRTPNTTKIGPTRAQRKAAHINAFRQRQAQLAENRRRTAANVERTRDKRRMQNKFNEMRSDFEKAYAKHKVR